MLLTAIYVISFVHNRISANFGCIRFGTFPNMLKNRLEHIFRLHYVNGGMLITMLCGMLIIRVLQTIEEIKHTT